MKAERVAAYNEKKAAKGPAAVGKSVVTLDVKVRPLLLLYSRFINPKNNRLIFLFSIRF